MTSIIRSRSEWGFGKRISIKLRTNRNFSKGDLNPKTPLPPTCSCSIIHFYFISVRGLKTLIHRFDFICVPQIKLATQMSKMCMRTELKREGVIADTLKGGWGNRDPIH